MATFTTPSGAQVDESGALISGPTGGGNTGGGNGGNTSTDDFLTQLQSKLMGSAGMVSSDNTQLEQGISDAIASVKKAGQSSDVATGMSYDRQIADQNTKNADAVTSAAESGRGFAVNSAVMSKIQEQNDKEIKDLEMRKTEALASGDAATAGKIADLQFSALQMRQQATQQMFTNLISMGDFAMKEQADKRAGTQQTFAENQAISGIALKYGITIKPGDTLDTITARAAPFASAEEKQSMALDAAKIREANANAAKALEGTSGHMDDLTASAIGDAIQNNPSLANIYANKMDPADFAKVENYITKQSAPKSYAMPDLLSSAQAEHSANTPYAQARMKIASDPKILNKADAYKALDAAYGSDKTTDTSSNPLDAVTGWFAKNVLKENMKPLRQ